MAGKNTVRLVEFKISEREKADIEAELADLLDEGFTIASQHEADGYLNYTLVRTTHNINMLIGGETDHQTRSPQQKYKLENGAVVPVNSGNVLH
ncbi:type I secretion C-terminal target domain-containing protein [Staphylococcus haemolyticus]|uniref:Hyphothetical protein n=1 Tax=Escherichia phage 4MG TaxID=1391428 RepID=V5KST1_9CAUD|nr:type I secretion C-terminal target domain-containing protein [Staphylococcus haemolyticus]YP_008857225.1 DNA ligase [Escherichia phage 4MG]AGZ17483.1 hyphothetical protein [Escherichia phage 4MG]MCC3722108.1 type I secretion C-terminal target domain-containing protein [Staphylococcus haemolyticus]